MDIESIILRYLDGSASREEKQTLLDWLRESEEHRSGFMQTRDLWLSSNAVYGTELEIDLALERFRERVRRKRIGRSFGFRHIAAALLFLLLLGGALWSYDQGFTFGRQTTVLVTAPNSKGHFLLPDGSEVWLNKESRLTFSRNGFERHRKVELSGEAYFEVRKNSRSPFSVMMSQLKVEVLGTEFNASHYPGDSCIEVTLNKGSVQLFGEELPEAVKLKPGDRFVYNKQTHASQLDPANPYYYSLWRAEQLEFDNRPLAEIIPCLETWYRMQIHCPAQLDSTRLTFTVKNENPDEIMRFIGYIAPIRYQIENNTITITEKNKP